MKRAARASVAVLASVVLLAACSATPPQLGAHRVAATLDVVEHTDPATSALPALAPGYLATGIVQFDSQPVAARNVFVSMLFPRDALAGLNFIGLSAAGTEWQVETNPSCVGFVVTRDGDRELVVILDSDATAEQGKIATRTVATAFDAESGAIAWGPVDVPGPARGSGLNFADTPKGIVSDDVMPAVMLSAHDGTVSVDENAAEASTVVHESNGTGLVESAGVLTAIDTTTEAVLWDAGTLPRPTGVDAAWQVAVRAADDASQGDIVFLNWTGPGGGTVVSAHNVRTGALRAEFVGGVTGPSIIDQSSGNIAVASAGLGEGMMTLTAIDPDSGTLWEQTLTDATAVSASATDIYLRDATGNISVDWAGGSRQELGDSKIPVAVLADGSGLFATGEPYEYILASPEP